MKRLLTFGTYVFPDTQEQFEAKFTDIVQRTSRLPGLSGGYDELGTGLGPSEVGSVRCRFLLAGGSRDQITAMRDTLNTLPSFGSRKLWMQPADQSQLARYCNARCINVQAPENAKMHDLNQWVTVNFQVSYPRWLRDEGQELIWGEGTWGEQNWGGNYPTFNITAADQEISITNDGNAIALARFVFTATSGGSNLSIQRMIDGSAVESISVNQSFVLDDVLNVDSRRLLVQHEGVGIYSSLTYDHPAWIQLPGGVNTLRVSTTSGTGILRVIYAHTWY